MTLHSPRARPALVVLVAATFLAWAAPGYARTILPGPESENVPTNTRVWILGHEWCGYISLVTATGEQVPFSAHDFEPGVRVLTPLAPLELGARYSVLCRKYSTENDWFVVSTPADHTAPTVTNVSAGAYDYKVCSLFWDWWQCTSNETRELDVEHDGALLLLDVGGRAHFAPDTLTGSVVDVVAPASAPSLGDPGDYARVNWEFGRDGDAVGTRLLSVDWAGNVSEWSDPITVAPHSRTYEWVVSIAWVIGGLFAGLVFVRLLRRRRWPAAAVWMVATLAVVVAVARPRTKTAYDLWVDTLEAQLVEADTRGLGRDPLPLTLPKSRIGTLLGSTGLVVVTPTETLLNGRSVTEIELWDGAMAQREIYTQLHPGEWAPLFALAPDASLTSADIAAKLENVGPMWLLVDSGVKGAPKRPSVTNKPSVLAYERARGAVGDDSLAQVEVMMETLLDATGPCLNAPFAMSSVEWERQIGRAVGRALRDCGYRVSDPELFEHVQLSFNGAYTPPLHRHPVLLVPSSSGVTPTLEIAPSATVAELVAALDEWPASALGVVALPPSGSSNSADVPEPHPN